jgi:hypothetical protein
MLCARDAEEDTVGVSVLALANVHHGHHVNLGKVVEAEVARAVDDDAGDRRAVAAIHASDPIGLDRFCQAVDEPRILSLPRGLPGRYGSTVCCAGVSCEASVCELEGIADRECSGTRCSAGSKEACEPPGKPNFLARSDEDLLVFLLEGKVHGLPRAWMAVGHEQEHGHCAQCACAREREQREGGAAGMERALCLIISVHACALKYASAMT